MSLTLLFFVALLQSLVVVNGEELYFQTPQLSEEEENSGFVPSNMKCDACTAVVYQINQAFQKEETKSNGKKLKESEYLDVFERVCNSKTFDSYGVKNVGGTNRISGAGLPADKEEGVKISRGKWPKRMSRKCFSFIDELGEDAIYDQFRLKADMRDFLCKEVTADCTEEENSKDDKEEL